MTYDPSSRDGGPDGPGLGTLMLVLLRIAAGGSIYYAFEMRRQATLAAVRAERAALAQAEQARAQAQAALVQAASAQPDAMDDERADPTRLAEQLKLAREERDRLESEVASLRETVAELQRRLDEANDVGSDRPDPAP